MRIELCYESKLIIRKQLSREISLLKDKFFLGPVHKVMASMSLKGYYKDNSSF